LLSWRGANKEEEADWEKYREIDLAPMEPITDGENAEVLVSVASNVSPGCNSLGSMPFEYSALAEEMQSERCNIPSLPQRPSLLLEQGRDENEDAEIPYPPGTPSRISSLLQVASAGYVDTDTTAAAPHLDAKELGIRLEHPTFATVIGMLPKAMFWSVAAPISRLSNMAYDAMVDVFTGNGEKASGE
jgi:hypothetical protein